MLFFCLHASPLPLGRSFRGYWLGLRLSRGSVTGTIGVGTAAVVGIAIDAVALRLLLHVDINNHYY